MNAATPSDADRPQSAGPMLRVLSGAERGRVVPLGPDELTLGRGDDADVVLQDEERGLSRVHARILRQQDGRFAVTGLGGNGTTVDGVDATGRQLVLKHGDVLGLGSLRLRFEHPVARADGGTRPPAGGAVPADPARRRRLLLLVGGLVVWTVVIIVLVVSLRGEREPRAADDAVRVETVIAVLRGAADAAPPDAVAVAEDLRALMPDPARRAAIERGLLDAALLEHQGRPQQAVHAWQAAWDEVVLRRRERATVAPVDGQVVGDAFGQFVREQLERLGADAHRRD